MLIGDAFATTCPTGGTGVDKVLTDVERLAALAPGWLAAGDTGAAAIAHFYADPGKRACDADARRMIAYARAMALDPGLAWSARRWRNFLVQSGRGWLRRKLVRSRAEGGRPRRMRPELATTSKTRISDTCLHPHPADRRDADRPHFDHIARHLDGPRWNWAVLGRHARIEHQGRSPTSDRALQPLQLPPRILVVPRLRGAGAAGLQGPRIRAIEAKNVTIPATQIQYQVRHCPGAATAAALITPSAATSGGGRRHVCRLRLGKRAEHERGFDERRHGLDNERDRDERSGDDEGAAANPRSRGPSPWRPDSPPPPSR